MKRIYLDSAATTPLDPLVIEAMMPYMSENFANTSSIHSFGQESAKSLEDARDEMAAAFACDPMEVVFNSGATEGNNTVIFGVYENYKNIKPTSTPHIIISSLEHSSVFEPCKYLEKSQKIELSIVKPSRDGVINPIKVGQEIRENTILISIIHTSNEIGSRQPIHEIGKMIERANLARSSSHKIMFHSDVTQAAGYCSIDGFNSPKDHSNLTKSYLKVDFLTFSAHKFSGPKGVGVMIASKFGWTKLFHGGAQEFEQRAGTVNLPSIIGLAKAIELRQKKLKTNILKISKLQEIFEKELNNKIKNIKVIGLKSIRSPHISTIYFPGIDGQKFVIALDLAGVAASFGSACSSGSMTSSQAIESLNLGVDAKSCIRFSFMPSLSETDIISATNIITDNYFWILNHQSRLGNQTQNEFQDDSSKILTKTQST